MRGWTPQLESLSSELARALNETLTSTTPALRLHASHDYAVARLREHLNEGGRTRLDLQYRGSIDALAALCHGACDVAGFHIAHGPLQGEILGRYAKWMKPRIHRLVRFVTRTQGLVVAPGNPKVVRSVADLARPGVRLINRQRGSGTRTLLEQLLATPGWTAPASKASKTRSTPTPRSPHSWPGGSPTSASASRRPPTSSGSTSSRWRPSATS